MSTDHVLDAESFQKIDRKTLITILEMDDLSVRSELSLFLACLRWAEAHAQEGCTLRDILGPEVLRHIRFRTLTPLEFVTRVCPTKIFTVAEERNIWHCLYVKTTRMPQGFTNNTSPRTPFYSVKNQECLLFSLSNSGNQYQGNQNWLLNFSFSTRVFIQGVFLCAWRYNVSSPYDEDMEIVLRKENKVIATAKYKGQVSHGSFFSAYFPRPVLIDAESYKISLVYADNAAYYFTTNVSHLTCILRSGVKLSNISGHTQICGFMITALQK